MLALAGALQGPHGAMRSVWGHPAFVRCVSAPGARMAARMAAPPAVSVAEAKAQLFGIVERDRESTARGSRATLSDKRLLDELVALLEAEGPVDDPKSTGLLAGAWQLLYTLRGNTGIESTEWLTYLLENGPSPVQRFVIGSVGQVTLVYQTLDEALTRFVNVIDFEDTLGGRLNLEAAVDSVDDDGQLNIRFDNAFFIWSKNPITKQPLAEPLRLPYPVPFRLLPNESRGYLKTTFLDDELRLARGNRGSVFVLRRMKAVPPAPAA
ncbi:hypothetical protein T492DRAFT_1072901 [Pavlovales sp. CCMP2436]|nr:hypothetical protein T492DRAFT_1072901 [Pavlovales sp. CCMP2436]